ncbi:GIY-YIG nuclease family protein [Candidatus Nomurabacteria bacterium]|nr:GIY-YIG nuclease family protein [Candidatus Nomurabacteria bacterium]
MFTVYVLQDDSGRLYKGVTNNLSRRLREHKLGKTKSTSQMMNIKIVYTEEHNDWKVARGREVYLKTAAGRKFLKKIMRV